MHVRGKARLQPFAGNDDSWWYCEAEDGQRYRFTYNFDDECAMPLYYPRDDGKWITIEVDEDGRGRFVCLGPLFKHDCDRCEFWGVYFGLDVWYCASSDGGCLGGSIIARYSDGPADYGSSPLCVVLRHLEDPTANIDDDRPGGPRVQPFRDWLFSSRGSKAEQAWTVALAVQGMKFLSANAKEKA